MKQKQNKERCEHASLIYIDIEADGDLYECRSETYCSSQVHYGMGVYCAVELTRVDKK